MNNYLQGLVPIAGAPSSDGAGPLLSRRAATPWWKHTETLSKQQLGTICISLLVIAEIATVCRLAIRYRRSAKLLVDDYLAAIAALLAIALQIVYKHGFDAQVILMMWMRGAPMPLDTVTRVRSAYLKLQFSASVLFFTILWAVKLSFLFFFRRLSGVLKLQRALWWVVTMFTTMSYFACLASYLAYCSTFEGQACVTPSALQRALISIRFCTGMDITSDFLILIFPTATLWGVKISLEKKIVLFAVCGAGVLIIFTSIARIRLVGSAIPDPSWLALWSSIESSVGKYLTPVMSHQEHLADLRSAIFTCSIASFRGLFSRGQSSDPRRHRQSNVIFMDAEFGSDRSGTPSRSGAQSRSGARSKTTWRGVLEGLSHDSERPQWTSLGGRESPAPGSWPTTRNMFQKLGGRATPVSDSAAPVSWQSRTWKGMVRWAHPARKVPPARSISAKSVRDCSSPVSGGSETSQFSNFSPVHLNSSGGLRMPLPSYAPPYMRPRGMRPLQSKRDSFYHRFTMK